MYSHMEGPRDLGLPFLGKSWIRSSNRACGETEEAEEVDQTSLPDFSRKARWLEIVFMLKPCGWTETTAARVKGGGCCLNHSSEPCGWASLLGWEFQWWPKTNQAALLKGGDRISNLDMSSLKTSALPCFHCISGWVHKVPCAGSPGGATSWGSLCVVISCWVTGGQGRQTEHNPEQPGQLEVFLPMLGELDL